MYKDEKISENKVIILMSLGNTPKKDLKEKVLNFTLGVCTFVFSTPIDLVISLLFLNSSKNIIVENKDTKFSLKQLRSLSQKYLKSPSLHEYLK